MQSVKQPITAIGNVVELWRYPISSLMGEQLAQVHITEQGVRGDRCGALFDEVTHEIVSPPAIRKWNVAPQLAARTNAEGEIEVTANGADWHLYNSPTFIAETARLFGSRMLFRRYGESLPTGIAKQRYACKPIHLLSVQAITSLQKLLPNSLIDARRFRPNIVVDLPNIEGQRPECNLIGKEFTIGGVRLRGLEPSGRCAFTTLAQVGLPEDRAVLRALIAHFEKNFGIYCEVLSSGDVGADDAVCMERAESDELAIAEQARTTAPRAAERPTAKTAPSQRFRLGNVTDIRQDEICRVEVADFRPVIVVQHQGEFSAFIDRCPHAGASMSEGFVEGDHIVCPLHFAEFNLHTGQASNAPPGCRDLRRYSVVRESDDLYLIT